ncbi:hypothetical protein ACKAMS_28895 [Rhodococcus sp. 5A-K4]|uniref:hypothetical protein n=1 Tax=Rhodococcus sp. 5A-K4 TaxID=3384442 RepID=UPI0038D474F8
MTPPYAIGRADRWSAAISVCDVEYREYVGGGLRHPSYKGCAPTNRPTRSRGLCSIQDAT